jgi:hypothetical protein
VKGERDHENDVLHDVLSKQKTEHATGSYTRNAAAMLSHHP